MALRLSGLRAAGQNGGREVGNSARAPFFSASPRETDPSRFPPRFARG